MWFLSVLFLAGYAWGQDCPLVPDDQRRDCYPWPDADRQTCERRGCAWCPLETTEYPWCFADDTLCPSDVPENQRADCHPEPGASKESCLAKSCIWCVTETPDVPWCFNDPTVSQGGEVCPPHISDFDRVDCWPHQEPSKENCLTRNCYWCESANEGVPWCFKPPVQGYMIEGNPIETAKGYRVNLKRKNFPTWFGGDVWDLRVDVEFQEDERLRVKIYDLTDNRFEVPLDIESPPTKADNPLYDIEFSDTPAFNFKIIRRSTGEVLFDTSVGGLVFSDQGIQIAAKLPTANVYGFGETEHHSFRHDMNFREWGMWARDQPVMQGNVYGVHPFFTALDTNHESFGCLILNSNAQEVKMTPMPGFVYRTIGGILDMYFFLGPSPENVVQQYTEAIGRPVMVPYWSLGFHLSRYGYDSIQVMRETIDRMRQYDIPHDVQHGDIDYFRDRLDFTYDEVNYAGLPEYVNQLKAQGTRFITILDPCIDIGQAPGSYPPFDTGNAADVWIKESDGTTNAQGKVWPPNDVYFPDYSNPDCQQWWIDETVAFDQVIDFDGLWIDMNEPASFVTGSVKGCYYNNLNNPIYKPRAILGDVLADKTLCPDYIDNMGRQYDTHNLYGWSECEPSLRAARAAHDGRRSIVISRSTFPGAGKYAVHWLGDNHAQWSNMHYSIIGMMEFNLFGFPFVGADICGFLGDTTEELCRRWSQLGSFYTFARNHNGAGWAEHDPANFGPAFAANIRDVLQIRYTLLPYLYTLHHYAHADGNTVIRPLFHEFVTDIRTHGVDRQFLWGPAFMIAPVLTQGATSVQIYFPDARWYDWYTGGEMSFRGATGGVNAPIDIIPLYIRGGYILPTQRPANTTVTSRTLPMGLIVALDDNAAAQGSLFWDEGDTVDTYENGEYFMGSYSVSSGTLTSSVTVDGYPEVGSLVFEDVTVLGLGDTITSVTVNGGSWSHYYYDGTNQVLRITDLGLQVNTAFTINWV